MNRMLGTFVLLVFFAVGSSTAQSQPEEKAEDQEELEYLELVMNIFRYHVKALELLSDTESKYSDNVVNHAQALWHTSGLLDHIYPAKGTASDREWPWKSEKEFEDRVKANRKATKQLRKAAGEWLEGGERGQLIEAIENVKESCRNCHGELRDWP